MTPLTPQQTQKQPLFPDTNPKKKGEKMNETNREKIKREKIKEMIRKEPSLEDYVIITLLRSRGINADKRTVTLLKNEVREETRQNRKRRHAKPDPGPAARFFKATSNKDLEITEAALANSAKKIGVEPPENKRNPRQVKEALRQINRELKQRKEEKHAFLRNLFEDSQKIRNKKKRKAFFSDAVKQEEVRKINERMEEAVFAKQVYETRMKRLAMAAVEKMKTRKKKGISPKLSFGTAKPKKPL